MRKLWNDISIIHAPKSTNFRIERRKKHCRHYRKCKRHCLFVNVWRLVLWLFFINNSRFRFKFSSEKIWLFFRYFHHVYAAVCIKRLQSYWITNHEHKCRRKCVWEFSIHVWRTQCKKGISQYQTQLRTAKCPVSNWNISKLCI